MPVWSQEGGWTSGTRAPHNEGPVVRASVSGRERERERERASEREMAELNGDSRTCLRESGAAFFVLHSFILQSFVHLYYVPNTV